jgi:hypothetical protein
MTNKNRKHDDNFFPVSCNGDTLRLPAFLYPDFERCVRCEEGMQIISEIFDTYSKFTNELKETFQFSIIYYEKSIIDFADIRSMIRAFYKVYVIKD